jgi:hypothetical protein
MGDLIMIFYAEIENWTDRRDNDAIKIVAPGLKEAKYVAKRFAECRGGVSVGQVIPGSSKDKDDKRMLRYLRSVFGGRVEKWSPWMKGLLK